MRFLFSNTPLLIRAVFFMVLASGRAAWADAPAWNEFVAGLDSTSPKLTEARLKLAAARSAYTRSRAFPNPVVFTEQQTLRGDAGDENETTLGIEQPLGSLWSRNSAISAQRHSFEAAQAAYDESRRMLIVQVVSAAARYRALAQQSALLDSVVTRAEAARRAMEARRHEGDISDYDVQRFQAEWVQLQNRRVLLSAEQNRIAGEFVELTGRSMEALIALSPPELSAPALDDPDSAVRYALEHRPQLREKSGTMKAERAALAASKWNQLPDFSLGIAHKTADPDLSGLVWQAQIEIPIWGQRRSERRLAQATQAASEIEYFAARARTEQEVRAAVSEWTLLKSMTASHPSFDAADADLNLKRALELYASGEFGSLELIDALRTSLDAVQTQLDLQTAELTANLELRRVTGLAILE